MCKIAHTNTGFINGLPKKWLAFCQSLRNTNHVKESELASLFGKLKYEENLINNIYDTNKEKTLVSATPLLTVFFSTSIVHDFQDSPDDEEDTRISQEYMNDLEEEYQARALFANSIRLKGNQRFSSAKANNQTKCHKCGKKGHFARDYWSKTSVPSYQSPFKPKLLHSSEHKPELRHTKDFESKYNKVKAKQALLSSSVSAPSASLAKKGLLSETYDWDEDKVSYDDNEVTEVKALMALTDEERVSVSKESARNGEWIKISMKMVHTLLEMKDNNDRKSFLDYLCIDLNYVEEYINNLVIKHRNLVQELKTCKERLLVFITGSNKPKLSKAEDSTLSNHDTGKYVAPLPPLEKLTNVEPVFEPKTIKSILNILKSKSTFKIKTLKGITINEPFSAPARGNKSSSASKTNSALAGKIISLRRGIKPRNPQNIIKNYETCGSNVHTTSDHNDIEWFRKREALQAKKVESFKASKTESSSALRSSGFLNKTNHPNPNFVQRPAGMYENNSYTIEGYGYGIVFKNMIGVLTYFLEFQIEQSERSISINKERYGNDLLRKYEKIGSSVNTLNMFSNDTEDVAAARCCANILWIKSHLTDYGIIYEKAPIACNHNSAIAISNNLIQHSNTKLIDIRSRITF
ncbi:retrovirus-related pol polyprotein from transposon TNT 1-94 [Tanacetum coccineum]